MSLITKEVEVGLNGRTIKHYEKLGYKIPKYIDKRNRIKIKRGTKILVKIEDLQEGSNIKVRVKCDNLSCCEEYELNYQQYLNQTHDGKIYCKKCANTILHSGENHPRWKTDKTQEEREKDRKSNSKYTDFVKKVMTRDNHTCKCCNKKLNHNGVVHHLDGWDNFKEKRYDESNGITLCKICHKNFHSIYGYGNNTKEQFEEWIGKAIELVKYNGELPTTRQIYCVEEDKIYDSAKQLAKKWNVNFPQIYDVCNHKKTKKGYCKSVQGKHLLWLDEYEQCTEEDIQRYLEWCNLINYDKDINTGINNPNSKQVLCITTGKTFNTMKEASEFYNISRTSISFCCSGKRKTAGKLSDGTRLKWKYC